jgi:hypothetical protein
MVGIFAACRRTPAGWCQQTGVRAPGSSDGAEDRKEEVDRCMQELAEIDQFAPTAHQTLRDTATTVRQNYDNEIDKMRVALNDFDLFVRSINNRISNAEKRRAVIREVLDKFFR